MRKSVFFFIVVFLAAFTAARASFAADSIGARADFTYATTESSSSGITTTSRSSMEQYTLNLIKDLTTTISLSGDLRWNITENNGKRRESFYPFFMLRFNPPALYNVTFSHSRTETDPSEGIRVTSTNTNVAFSLPETKWPGANIAYSMSAMEDHESPQTMNSTNSSISLGLSKGFSFIGASAHAGYNFNQSMSEDKIFETKSENPSHSLTGGLSRSFLDNKLSASASLSYQTTESTIESTGAPSRFDVGISGNSGWAYDNQLLVFPNTSITLTSEPELINTNTSAAVSPALDLNNANQNIGIGFSFSQSIHRIDVYITTTLSDTTLPFTGYNFGWDIYTSSDNITWTLIASPTQVYNPTWKRFELSFTETNALYFKAVNTVGNGGVAINVTEIEAVGFLLSTPRQSATQDSQRHSGGLSLSYKPMERLSLGFSLNYDKGEQGAAEGGQDSESIGKSYGANANYVAIPKYLNLSVNFNNTSNESKSVTDTESATSSYALSVSSSPLDTVNLGLTFNHLESETDGELVSEAESTGFSSSFMLYRGVDLGFSANTASSESFQSGTLSESTSYNVNTRLVPWRSLSIVWNKSISNSTTETSTTKTSTKSTGSSADFSFTPTRKVYLSGRFNLEPTKSQSYSLTLSPTNKIQASFNYNKDSASGAVSMGGSLNWHVLKPLSVGAVYSVTRLNNAAGDEMQTTFIRASLSF